MSDPRTYDLLWSKYDLARRLAERDGTLRPSGPPTIAGRYSLVERIGEGGVGYVYRALDRNLQREVALKTVDPQATWEAIALARIEHPNVVRLYEHGVDDGVGFLVLELLRGRTLTEWLRSERPSRREIVDVFCAAGAGLVEAHRVKLVHRDFKPDNVLVCDDGRVVVLDFGVAAAVNEASRDGKGTLGYMAPEQLTQKPITSSVDQFAFCVALWEALVGASPFLGPTIAARMDSYINGPRTENQPSGRIGEVLLRGLSLNPDRRWPTMQHLLTELARAERSRARRRPMLVVGAMACAAALTVGVLPLGPTTSPAGAGQLERAVDELDVRSLCLVAIAAAEDGRGEDAQAVLHRAEFRARGDRELKIVAAASDKVGLALFERQVWDDAINAHGRARRLYRLCAESDLEFRSLELERATVDARARHQ